MVGPDAVCAEWIVRTGGAVKFRENSGWIKDYNSLPSVAFKNYKPGQNQLVEIDASNSVAMSRGFFMLGEKYFDALESEGWNFILWILQLLQICQPWTFDVTIRLTEGLRTDSPETDSPVKITWGFYHHK